MKQRGGSTRSRLSTVVVQRFCKPKVGGSIPSPGTELSPANPSLGAGGATDYFHTPARRVVETGAQVDI